MKPQAKKPVRVLIVDDSAFVRKALTRIFDSDPGFTVAGAAASGKEAVEKALALKPDVITLDIMMPGMDGIETLRELMAKIPTPVVMLSQLTRQGANLTLSALELGAVDFVDKSTTDMMGFFDLSREIISKVGSAAASRQVSFNPRQVVHHAKKGAGRIDAAVLGASTGGPLALQMVIPKFPEDIGFGVLVVQHMPRGFTEPFARRLDELSRIKVKEAEDGEPVEPATALIAPAGIHMTVENSRTEEGSTIVKLSDEPAESIHRPSVNVLFASAAYHYGARLIGALMTGMGSDGALGMMEIKNRGGFTIAQDEATSTIFGMPRSAIEKGCVDIVLPVTSIAAEIIERA